MRERQQIDFEHQPEFVYQSDRKNIMITTIKAAQLAQEKQRQFSDVALNIAASQMVRLNLVNLNPKLENASAPAVGKQQSRQNVLHGAAQQATDRLNNSTGEAVGQQQHVVERVSAPEISARPSAPEQRSTLVPSNLGSKRYANVEPKVRSIRKK